MPTVEQVRNKVLRMMAKNFEITTTDDETIMVRHESSILSVEVKEWIKDNDGMNTVVVLSASILWNAKRTPALYEWVATTGQSFLWGRVASNLSDVSTETHLNFEHNLLGDNLDEPELVSVVLALLSKANELDDELQKKFGGKRTADL
ncbi:MAG: hypothetical protein DWI54_06380 [Chloroflexi bacterium]|nr:MAG: hypothetical protein DWI54_06380 [Chloroflexota bacterium]